MAHDDCKFSNLLKFLSAVGNRFWSCEIIAVSQWYKLISLTLAQQIALANTSDFLGISHNKARHGLCSLAFLSCLDHSLHHWNVPCTITDPGAMKLNQPGPLSVKCCTKGVDVVGRSLDVCNPNVWILLNRSSQSDMHLVGVRRPITYWFHLHGLEGVCVCVVKTFLPNKQL